MTTMIAGYESRFAAIEVRLERMDGKITLLSWMVGVLITLAIANLLLAFQVLSRLPHG